MSRLGIKFHFCKVRFPLEKPRKARRPYEDAPFVIVDGSCPVCAKVPFKSAGVKGTMVKGHDTYTADAGCTECNTAFGKLIVTVDTFFGIEEDERIAHMGIRIY